MEMSIKSEFVHLTSGTKSKQDLRINNPLISKQWARLDLSFNFYILNSLKIIFSQFIIYYFFINNIRNDRREREHVKK